MCIVQYTAAAALGSAARSENRGADQQAAMPESCDCFLRQRPYYILCLPKLPDLPFHLAARPTGLCTAYCLFEYYYIYTTTRTDGIEEGNSNSLWL